MPALIRQLALVSEIHANPSGLCPQGVRRHPEAGDAGLVSDMGNLGDGGPLR